MGLERLQIIIHAEDIRTLGYYSYRMGVKSKPKTPYICNVIEL